MISTITVGLKNKGKLKNVSQILRLLIVHRKNKDLLRSQSLCHILYYISCSSDNLKNLCEYFTGVYHLCLLHLIILNWTGYIISDDYRDDVLFNIIQFLTFIAELSEFPCEIINYVGGACSIVKNLLDYDEKILDVIEIGKKIIFISLV